MRLKSFDIYLETLALLAFSSTNNKPPLSFVFTPLSCNYDVRIGQRKNKFVWVLRGRHYPLLCVASVVGVSASSLQGSARCMLCWLMMELSQSLLLCKHSKIHSSEGKLEPIRKPVSAVECLLVLAPTDAHLQT